jgi:predicted DNA-binding transcriptional regulator AlpA
MPGEDKRKYRLLTEKEVSEWTRLAVPTLRSMRSRPGKDPIPYTKLGGKIVRYREDLLLKWLERRTF